MLTELPRVHTGIEGLDELLYGGLLEGDTVLLAGSPGTGKTSLGMQFLHSGATQYDDPGILITFEEFPKRIYRDAANYGWDFPRLERENRLKVIFTSPELIQQDILNEQGIITEMIREIGARRVVVDSISHFQQRPELHGSRREAIYGLMNALKRENLTSLLIRELPREEEVGVAPEDFLADALIVLSQKRVRGQRVRFAEVMKSRGTPHIPTRGMLLMGDKGLSIFSASRSAFFRLEEAASTGISALDDLLGGGIPYGTFYLLETNSTFHYQLLDANFLKEALDTDDVWVKVGSGNSLSQEMQTHLRGLGVSASVLDENIRNGNIRLLETALGNAADHQADRLVETIDKICQQMEEGRKVRLQIDVSSLALSLGIEQTLSLVQRINNIVREHEGVILGSVNPSLIGETGLEKIRYLADGIFCVWNQEDFNLLQVFKTVNSVRTRIHIIRETPKPPYIDII